MQGEIDYQNPIAAAADASNRRHGRAAAIVCALLLASFAAVAHLAVRGKSPTYDEPVHVLAGWEQLHHGDLRLDPENPPLWKYWAALPNGRDAIARPLTPAQMRDVGASTGVTDPFVVPTLFGQEGTDADAIVARSRMMMLALAVATGALLAWWSWRLGGAVAAVTATAAFALDPNFLAHGPLVKNDVVLALIFVGLVMAVWLAGRRTTAANAAAVALLCAAAVNVKFTGLVFGPIVLVLLLCRAMMPAPWPWFGRVLETRVARVGGGAALCALALLVSYAGTWGCYQFRFAPANDPNARFDTLKIIQNTAFTEVAMANPGRPPTPDDLRAWRPGPALRAIFFLDQNRLLPEAWLTGFAYTRSVSIAHQNFLLGEHSLTGWWHYFPFAMLVKAPIALVVAAAGALLVGSIALCNVVARRRGRRAVAAVASEPHEPRESILGTPALWTAICLTLPPAIYLLLAMGSNMHYGVRHVLPVYPFIYIALGLAAAHVWRRRPRATGVVLGLLALGLLAETTAAFPNYLPFFNAAAGGPRGGLKMLGCSNIDWGQDLKLLADWQRRHPAKQLHLLYYGVADPAYYGIRATELPLAQSTTTTRPAPLPSGPDDVIAVSATYLQGLYLRPHKRDALAPLRHAEPTEILGGSIYVFERR